jgi:hypothetical protein
MTQAAPEKKPWTQMPIARSGWARQPIRCILGLDMELLQRVAEAGGRLLRVQCYSEGGSEVPELVSGLLLTFDVGRILVWADDEATESGELTYMHVQDTEDLAGGLLILDEEEPWWRVLGGELCRARARRESQGVRLQFRPDENNPRFIELERKGRLVRISMDEGTGKE